MNLSRVVQKVPTISASAVLATVLMVPVVFADELTEPRGGQPSKGSKPSVENFTEQVTYQRAFEAVVWSMPAMIKYGMRRASLEIGAGDNVVCAWSAGAKPLLETLTPNNTSPYVTSTTDLRKGPVVLEVPKATDKAILFGQVADDWFINRNHSFSPILTSLGETGSNRSLSLSAAYGPCLTSIISVCSNIVKPCPPPASNITSPVDNSILFK